MPDLYRRSLVVLCVAVLGLAGCASAGATGEGSAAANLAPGVNQITVDNSHATAVDLRVFLQVDGGTVRHHLGDVPQNDIAVFTFDGDRGNYRLVAERVGSPIQSERLSIVDNANFRWTISGNRVVMSRR